MVRLRLYETLLLLPPQTFEGNRNYFQLLKIIQFEICVKNEYILNRSGSYTHLLRMLVSEFTLTENPGNTTTSLLRAVCHANDSVILGTWLQETDRSPYDRRSSKHFAA